MNRTLVAFAALVAIVGGAQAQSSVTLYGIADGGINYVSGQDGSKTRLASGIMEGTRFGFRGNEDLGGGYRSIFLLENRTELDTGGNSNRPASGSRLPDRFTTTAALGLPGVLQPVVNTVNAGIGAQLGVNLPGKFFDRQAYLGLVTPVGAILAGRQYTTAYELHATFDTMGTSSSLAFGQIATFPTALEIRTDNTLAYRIQTGPVTASIMYGFGEGSTVTGRLLSAMAMYRVDAFAVGLAYATRENELGQKALTNIIVGASAAIGPGTVFAQYIDIKDDNPGGLSPTQTQLSAVPTLGAGGAALVINAYRNALRLDAAGYHVGYRYINGPHTVSVAYSRYDDDRPANADVQSYGAVYSYALSKRTDVNFVLTRYDNAANAQAAPGGQGFLGGFTTQAGRDAGNAAIGVRHRF